MEIVWLGIRSVLELYSQLSPEYLVLASQNVLKNQENEAKFQTNLLRSFLWIKTLQI